MAIKPALHDAMNTLQRVTLDSLSHTMATAFRHVPAIVGILSCVKDIPETFVRRSFVSLIHGYTIRSNVVNGFYYEFDI